jgi:hypothetical protein
LTVLSEDSDELIRERSGNALLSQPLQGFVAALTRDAPSQQLFRYCGHNLIEKPEVATALARHWRCPAEFLIAAAKRLSSATIKEFFDDLERLSAVPALVSALLSAASLAPDQKQQLEELLRDNFESEEAFADATADMELAPEQRVTLLQRLSQMRVAERVQMALKGNREERIALIRDPCKVVQRAVLQSPRVTDSEIEFFASMANLNDEILRIISGNRKFRGNYTVVRNLINNPKTPLDVSLHLLPVINPQDLKFLVTNKNIPDTLRSSALRLHRKRNAPRTPE